MTDARKITALLLKRYPAPELALQFKNALELLIAVILQCTDARVNQVTATLFKKCEKAEDYATADPAA
jgi:endonuclease-3